jgi:hypothetical protein
VELKAFFFKTLCQRQLPVIVFIFPIFLIFCLFLVRCFSCTLSCVLRLRPFAFDIFQLLIKKFICFKRNLCRLPFLFSYSIFVNNFLTAQLMLGAFGNGYLT